MNKQQIIKKLTVKVKELDQAKNNKYRRQINRVIKQAVQAEKSLQLLSFTCSTINSQYLFSSTPWKYVSLNPAGNNLESDLPKLQNIIEELRAIYPRIELVILIGNTDPYYIYLQQFQGLKNKKVVWQRFSKRWERYYQKLSGWVKRRIPLQGIKIISWFKWERQLEKQEGASFEKQFSQTKNRLNNYFIRADLDWELRALSKQFGAGKYFIKLRKPSQRLLKDWIIRKFAEYAVQGLWIYEQFPNGILIQNEKPSKLRSKMYQPLIREKYRSSLPIIYPYGVDNTGYQ